MLVCSVIEVMDQNQVGQEQRGGGGAPKRRGVEKPKVEDRYGCLNPKYFI